MLCEVELTSIGYKNRLRTSGLRAHVCIKRQVIWLYRFRLGSVQIPTIRALDLDSFVFRFGAFEFAWSASVTRHVLSSEFIVDVVIPGHKSTGLKQ